MGTRSRIGVMHGDKVKSVYCHWDGYPEHNGFILQNFYDSVKANKLVAMGNLSALGAEIGEAHDFHDNTDADDYKDTRCTFYGRDRGEDDVAYQVHTDFDSFIECVEGSWGEWYYILKDDVWYCGNVYGGNQLCKTLTPLADVLAKIEESV
jgi:hypothetical protein